MNKLFRRHWGSFWEKLSDACRFCFRAPRWDSLLAYLLDLEINRKTEGTINGMVGGKPGIIQLTGLGSFECASFWVISD